MFFSQRDNLLFFSEPNMICSYNINKNNNDKYINKKIDNNYNNKK